MSVRSRTWSPPAVTRKHVVERLRDRLLRTNWPRLHMSAITVLTAGSGFVTSWALLRIGVDRMAVRYGLAVLVAYAVFLGFLRFWLHLHRRQIARPDGNDAADAVEETIEALGDGGFELAGRGVEAAGRVFRGGGGHFGGAGASVDFDAPAMAPMAPPLLSSPPPAATGSSSGAGFDLGDLIPDLDLDEAVAVVVAIAVALSLLAVSAWLVFTAPTLFAELLVDSALAGGLYRSLRRQDTSTWFETALRKTALPFLLVMILCASGGWAIQHFAPHARSIGDVWRDAPADSNR